MDRRAAKEKLGERATWDMAEICPCFFFEKFSEPLRSEEREVYKSKTARKRVSVWEDICLKLFLTF